MTRSFSILVASDGSREARAAVALTLRVPWPGGARVVGVVANATPPLLGVGALYKGVLERAYRQEAQRLEDVLSEAFAGARVTLTPLPPADAILREAKRCSADVVVVGSRGLGLFVRFPLGSVSRRILREAPRSVLVAKGRSARVVRRFMIAVDGSPASRRAVRLVGRLKPGKECRVRLVAVAPPVPLPLVGRLPASVRREVSRFAAEEERKRASGARRHLEAAAGTLQAAGWRVHTEMRRGTPLVELLRVAHTWRPDVVVSGARGATGLERLLLGSVATGLVSRAEVPVLVVK